MNRRAIAALLAASVLALALFSCSDAPQEGVSTDTGAIAGDTGSGEGDTGLSADSGGSVADAGANDAGADCPFGCNAGERCIDGACVPDDVADGGGGDTGGGEDAGTVDAGTQDGGVSDAGPDAGKDAGLDAGLDAGAPDAATPDAGPATNEPVWFLQITDTHIGENQAAAPGNLDAFVGGVLPVVAPTVAFNTGDLTDTGSAAEFNDYLGRTSGKVPAWPRFIEVIGNHDKKTDEEKNFISTTLTGRAGAGTHGVTYIDAAPGRVQVVRTNTVDSTTNMTNISGYMTGAQKDDLLALPDSPVPVRFPVLLAHHPFTALAALKTDVNMEAVIARYRPQIYFCGHMHATLLSWHDDTLVVQGDTLGRMTGSEGHFMLAAIDDDGPSAREIAIDYTKSPPVTWPVAMITTPGDVSLATTNPVPKKIAPGKAGVPLRAIAFSPSGVSAADYRIDSGAWKSMSGPGPVWEATFTAPSAANSHIIEIRATSGEGTASHTVKVNVAP